jgi:hypothetical protein
MTDIPRLIEKLEAATEGSIGLDVEVLHACGYGNSTQYPTAKGGWKGNVARWITPTRSLDSALRLVDEVLPKCHRILRDGEPFRNPECMLAPITEVGRVPIDGAGRTLATAICIALLKVLKYQQEAQK